MEFQKLHINESDSSSHFNNPSLTLWSTSDISYERRLDDDGWTAIGVNFPDDGRYDAVYPDPNEDPEEYADDSFATALEGTLSCNELDMYDFELEDACLYVIATDNSGSYGYDFESDWDEDEDEDDEDHSDENPQEDLADSILFDVSKAVKRVIDDHNDHIKSLNL